MTQLRARIQEPDVDVTTTAAFFTLAYGRDPDENDRSRLDALLPEGVIRDAADAHRVLAGFDAQSHPTPFAVRASEGSLAAVTLDGFSLWIDTSDPAVSAVVQAEHDWEAHVSDVLKTALVPGATFVDVGANIGYHTFHSAAIVGPSGAVVAFAPSAENCRLLQLSREENHAEHVSIIPIALDRDTGLRSFSMHLGTNAGLIPDTRTTLLSGRGTLVYAMTFDELAPPRVDVMKVDVEGAEFRVLDGARKTIERDKPLIIMEFSCEMVQRVSEVDPQAALQGLLDLGYRLYILDRETKERVAFQSASALLADWGDPFRIEDLLLEPH
jgi:FkbM family methyltransferase